MVEEFGKKKLSCVRVTYIIIFKLVLKKAIVRMTWKNMIVC